MSNPWEYLRCGSRSAGTSEGMRRWYRLHVPMCRSCRRVRLVRYSARAAGLCAKCRAALPPEEKYGTHPHDA